MKYKIQFNKMFSLFCVFFLIIVSCGCINQNENNGFIVSDDGSTKYSSIQNAIDEANEHEIIRVKKGIYYEQLQINKTIDLIGENTNTTILDGNQSGSVVIINADNVTLSGFTIRNSGTKQSYYDMDAGIEIYSNNTKISNCTCENNIVGLQIKHRNSNNIINNISIESGS